MNHNLLPAIFLEAAHHASLLPFASEATIYAMQSFGETSLGVPVATAILGATIGHGLNFGLGRLIMHLPSSPKDHRKFQFLERHAQRYGFIALVFAPLALGNWLSLAAGMLGVSPKRACLPLLLGLGYYYGQLLLP